MKKSILMTLIGFLAIGSIYAAKSPTSRKNIVT